MSKITEALATLDPKNDTHWTADGLPRLDIVRTASQNPLVTREKIDSEAPGFVRTNAAAYFSAQRPTETAPETQAAQTRAPTQPEPQSAPVGTAASTPSKPDPAGETSDQKAEQPEVDVKSAIREQLAKAMDALPRYREYVDEATADLQRLLAFIDECNEKLAEIDPPKSHAQTIQDYLAQQKKSAQERAARSEILKKNGINLADILKTVQPSPLDVAFASRPNTQRG